MIIDFIGENMENDFFYTNLNFCHSLQDCNYEIGIRQIILEIEMFKIPSIFMLTTNLIDRCSTNPNRAVSYFNVLPNKRKIIINFPSVDYFQLERIHSLPCFGFKDPFGTEKIKLRSAIIRAQVRKCSDSVNH